MPSTNRKAPSAAEAEPLGGSAQALIQSVAFCMAAFLGAPIGFFGRVHWNIEAWVLMSAAVVSFFALGISVDALRRRWGFERRLSAPTGARLCTALVVAALLVAAMWCCRPWGGFFPAGVVAAAICWAPLYLVVARIVGPLWHLTGVLLQEWRHRGLEPATVIGARAPVVVVQERDGTQRWLRSPADLPLGAVFLDLVLDEPGSPYRSLPQGRLLSWEAPVTRTMRRRWIAIAAIGLVAGIAWAFIPLGPLIGRHLTEVQSIPFSPPD